MYNHEVFSQYNLDSCVFSILILQEMKASDNPSLDKLSLDPTVVCTGYKKNRFFVFTRREPDQDNRYKRLIKVQNSLLSIIFNSR